jgi:hypothetical protein
MKQAGWLLLLLTTVTMHLKAQRYLVRFKNKASSPYSFSSPSAYLSQRAIDRRQRYSIPIDSTDLPVNPVYLNSIRSVSGVTILNTSRWLNQVSVLITDPNALTTINSFPFVQASTRIASRLRSDIATDRIDAEYYSQAPQANMRLQSTAADFYDYGSTKAQIHIHNGEFLHNIGLRGQTMYIGMLDEGFSNYTTLKGFDSVNMNGQILNTWDFVNNEADVANDAAHGEQCFSTIAVNLPGQFIGSAPKAKFLLFKTEDTFSEYPIEEHNWVCGAERIDSAGGDVISSSVGYKTFDDPSLNHTYADLNGNTTIAATGADLASKKGLAVINAAGNDGSSSWHYILTPADGDSVLAVGAVTSGGAVWPNSSYGPSSDGQVKPDVASVGSGTAIQFNNGAIGSGFGTSFACPNLAGLVTCLWQGFPEFNNIKVLNAVRQAGSIYATPNDRIGYGIPDLKKALVNLLKDFATSTVESNNCQAVIKWISKDVSAMKYEIERKTSTETSFKKITERNGTGILFSTHNYEFTDVWNNVSAGPVSYRIRQIVDTATATFTADYIDTVSTVATTSCSKKNKIRIVPNPARSSISLQIGIVTPIDKLSIRIVNMQGSTVALYKKVKTEGETTFDIPVYYLPAGKYLVSVYDNKDLIETRELVKL